MVVAQLRGDLVQGYYTFIFFGNLCLYWPTHLHPLRSKVTVNYESNYRGRKANTTIVKHKLTYIYYMNMI